MKKILLRSLSSKYLAFTIARLALHMGSAQAPLVVAISLFMIDMRLLRDKTPRKNIMVASFDSHLMLLRSMLGQAFDKSAEMTEGIVYLFCDSL
jgi:hypothetical protein